MAHSLELRSPLLDHEVLELGLSLPDALKLRGREGKVALRRAFADVLPPEVAGRGKTGFGVPLARWFRGELRELAGDVLLGDDGLLPARGGRAAARRARRRRRRPRAPALVPRHARALAAGARRRAGAGLKGPARLLADPARGRRPAPGRPAPRARRDPRRVHREERRLRAHLRPHRHLRLHPGRAVRVHAAALRLLPRPDLLDLRPPLARRSGSRRSRSRSRPPGSSTRSAGASPTSGWPSSPRCSRR